MKKISASICILGIAATFASLHRATKHGVLKSESMPSSIEIYETINVAWGDAKFERLKTFVNGLGEKHSNYVPAQIAEAGYIFIFDSDVSAAIKGLERIHCASTNDLLSFSPLFSELLNGKIDRLHRTKRFRDDHGYTKAMLKNKLDPRKARKDKLQKEWMSGSFQNWTGVVFKAGLA